MPNNHGYIMENQMEKKMENEMETGGILGFKDILTPNLYDNF